MNSRSSDTAFVDAYCREGKPVKVDGQTLSLAAVTAAARFNARVELTDDVRVKVGRMRLFRLLS